jgi:hypothetical protein
MTRQPWLAPPPPLGVNRGRRSHGGYTATGRQVSDLGIAVERALARALGWEPANAAHGRVGPFDLLDGRDAYEVKSVTRESTEYKCKPKAGEVDEKLAYAHRYGLRPHVLIAVVDGEVVYAYAREGVRAYRLTPDGYRKGWVFLGVTTL